MPDATVEEVPANECKVTETTVLWARLRDCMKQVDDALFDASQLARIHMKNDDLSREFYTHRVNMQYTNLRIRNALKHDRFPSPYFKSVSELEAALKHGGSNGNQEPKEE